MSRVHQTPRPTSPPTVPALLLCWNLTELRDCCVHELLKLQLDHISELEGALRSYRQELSTIQPFAPGARSSPPVPFLDELHDRFADQGCPTVVLEGPSLSPFLPRPLPDILQARSDSAGYASTSSSSP